MQVQMPEKRSALGSIWNRISNIAGIWQGGKNIASMGSDIFGAGNTGSTGATQPAFGAATGASGQYTLGIGSSAAPAAPAVATPAAEATGVEAGTAGASEGTAWGAAGSLAPPIAAGAYAAYDIYKNRDNPSYGWQNAGIKPYMNTEWMNPKVSGFDSDAITRRLDYKSELKGIDFDATSKMIQNLNIDKATKDSMLAKVGKAADLTKRIV
jgi:hypothetical protein